MKERIRLRLDTPQCPKLPVFLFIRLKIPPDRKCFYYYKHRKYRKVAYSPFLSNHLHGEIIQVKPGMGQMDVNRDRLLYNTP